MSDFGHYGIERSIIVKFPPYVHSIVPTSDLRAWPVAPQGWRECDFASTANALNLLVGSARYTKDEFIRKGWPFFQPRLGGTISPLKVWQLRAYGFGTHYGNLSHTHYEIVLRDLVDRGIQTMVELGVAYDFGKTLIYGQHTIVLVGYSDRYQDKNGQTHEEYYFVDSHWPRNGPFDLHSNDVDRDGDGINESFPGNRTLSREELQKQFRTGLYCPVFRTQREHNAWYQQIRPIRRFPILGWLYQELFSGSYDLWLGNSER